MIIRTEDMLEVSKFFKALSQRTANNMVSNLIEFDSDGTILKIKMCDGKMSDASYSIIYKIDSDEKFNCTISAELFLDLIPKITSETLEFEVKDEFLLVTGSGSYKFPALLTDNNLSAFVDLKIDSITSSWSVDGNILNSIYVNNSKQIQLHQSDKLSPVQRLYYLDREGAITFTSGACVNEFDLGSDVKLMLSDAAIKFFAFTKGKTVDINFGYNVVANNNQPRISFSTPTMEATYILPFNDLTISQVPVDAIRARARANYTNKVSIDAFQIKSIIDRLELFTEGNDRFNLSFNNNTLNLSTDNEKILETIYLADYVPEQVEFKLSIKEFKSAISNSAGKYFMIKFSKDDPAVVVCFANINNIIPKVED